MNRRNFTATSLATLLVPFPAISVAQTVPITPGFQVVEMNDGQLDMRFGGMARRDVAVAQHTLFQVASCSKTVTAIAVLTLVRDGKIDLDRPANLYLAGWACRGRAAQRPPSPN